MEENRALPSLWNVLPLNGWVRSAKPVPLPLLSGPHAPTPRCLACLPSAVRGMTYSPTDMHARADARPCPPSSSLLLGVQVRVVAADPINACTPLRNSGANNVSGALVIVRGGPCFYADKGLNVRASGGIGVVVVYNNRLPGPTKDDGSPIGPQPIYPNSWTYAVNMPFSFISKVIGVQALACVPVDMST